LSVERAPDPDRDAARRRLFGQAMVILLGLLAAAYLAPMIIR
jgi:hypothetical protein